MNLNKRQEYLDLGNALPNQYYHLKFDNHCYWRIALDNTLFAKWSDVIPAPAYRNISEDQLDYAIHLLKSYQKDEQLLIEHNRISLIYRGKK
ncbi:acetyltransferase [Nonlabens ulvanivorans]|uniref:acetyltransferase n=1 Tax=Nonlabens ulvanivorans TaxID=906888 RepID=UPI002941C101|nr:acetyltransferase [Nonlabens ulvanivorans]WOI22354.1 acetyltransferase [Nonlabens ulvanivorans]